MPSTVSWVLSLVMQTWLGTSRGISFSECRYATRSMKGTRIFSPGVSVAWNLPRRSTTQAFCCGTTLSERATKIAAITRMTMNTASIGSALVCGSVGFGGPLQQQAVAVDGVDHEGAGRGCAVPDIAGGPSRPAVLDLRRAVG